MLIEREQQMNKVTGRVCSTHKNNLLGQTVYFTSDRTHTDACSVHSVLHVLTIGSSI